MLSEDDTEAHEKLGEIEEMMEGAVEDVLTEHAQQAEIEPEEDNESIRLCSLCLGFSKLRSCCCFC